MQQKLFENIEAIKTLEQRILGEIQEFDYSSELKFKLFHKKKEYSGWIRSYCNKYNKKLPKGFWRKKKKQLMGMYFGIIREELKEEEKILRKEEFYRRFIHEYSNLINIKTYGREYDYVRVALDLVGLKELKEVYNMLLSDSTNKQKEITSYCLAFLNKYFDIKAMHVMHI